MSTRFALRLAAVALCGALALSACSSDQEKLAHHLANAQEYESQGKDKEALIELRNALQLDPKNADVNFRIAELMSHQNRFADAAFFYRETVRLDPTRTDAALAEAKLIMFDDNKRATDLVEQVLQREPDNAAAHHRRSEIALAAGDVDQALQSALTAIELAPKDGLMQMQLGIVYEAEIRQHTLRREPIPAEIYEKAAKAFEKADALLGGGASARVELGRIYAIWPEHRDDAEKVYRSALEVAEKGDERGRVAGAVMSYARATGNVDLLHWALQQMVENVPSNLPAWDELAALEEKREPGSGDAVYRHLLELRPDDEEAHVRFARFMASHDRLDAAIAHLEEQSKSGTDPAVALEALSAMELSHGDEEGARAAAERLQKEYPDHPRTSLALGRLALADRQFDQATELLRKYVTSEESEEGQQLLAVAELRRRNFPAAVAAVDAAIAIDSNDAGLLRLKIAIHEASGDWQQVLVTSRQLLRRPGIKILPGDRLRLARAFYQTGRPARGKEILQRLLATDPVPATVYLEYARREGANDPEHAREYLQRILAKAPRSEEALRLLAVQLVGEGQPKAALAALDRAAEAGPLPPSVLLLRAQVLAKMEAWTQAEDAARRAFAAAPNLTPALDLLAQIYTAQNRLDEAISQFEEAEQVGALPPAGEVLLARLHLASGHNDRARVLYEKALSQRTDLPGAKNDLAWLLADANQDLDRAQTLAQQAQQAEPENADFVDTLGYVYLRKGLNEPALQQLQYAIELAEQQKLPRPEFDYHLGLVLRALGREQDAAKAFQRALDVDAKFPHAEEARRELEAARASSSSTPG